MALSVFHRLYIVYDECTIILMILTRFFVAFTGIKILKNVNIKHFQIEDNKIKFFFVINVWL